MPLVFPRILPNFVDAYKGPTIGLYRYQSDSRAETRVAVGCKGANTSFELRYEGLDTPQAGEFIDFWDECNLDFEAGFCLYSFFIPRNHPVWRRVAVIHHIEQRLLLRSLDETRWIIRDPSEMTSPLCGLHTWTCKIEEVSDGFL